MSYTVVPVAFNGGANLIAGPIAITAFANGPDTIAAAGLGTASVRGDAVRVIGSTSNDADYIVLDVIDSNTVEVWPAPTVEAAAGNVEVREQGHRLDIVDEATVTAALIEAAMPDARIFGRRFRVPAATPGRGFGIYGFVIRDFQVTHTGATNTEITSTREVWFLDWDRDGAGILSSWNMQTPSGDPGTTEARVGDLADPADPRSVFDGSVLLGGTISPTSLGRMRTQFYGSFLASTVASGIVTVDDGQAGDGQIVGCVVDSALATPINGGTTNLARNVVLASPGFGFTPVGALTEARDILVARSLQFGIVFAATSEVVASGVTLSDAAFAPGNTFVFGSAFNFLDPGEDYTPGELFNLSSGAGRKSYTFNPRFVDVNFISGPSPISGLVVEIERINDARYVQVITAAAGSWTVTINGEAHTYVAAGGDGAAVIRNNLVTQINLGSQPVTAVAAAGALPAQSLQVTADVPDTPFTIDVTVPGGGAFALDPNSTAAGAPEYQPGPIAGSPFTTDAQGRINTDGVVLSRFTMHRNGIGVGAINHQYLVTVSSAFTQKIGRILLPARTFEADFPVDAAQAMGSIL